MRHCVNASGVGVRTAAAINIATIANFLFLLKKEGDTIPNSASIRTAIGISKTMPKARSSIVTKERYFDNDRMG